MQTIKDENYHAYHKQIVAAEKLIAGEKFKEALVHAKESHDIAYEIFGPDDE